MPAPQRILPVLHVTLLSIATTLTLASCSPSEHDVVVATVGKDVITLADFEKQYTKSAGAREAAATSSPEDRERFLDLLVNYRLKLNDAFSRGLQRRSDVSSEIEQYKGSLAASFLTERDVTGPGIRRLFSRRREEIRASHILILLSPNASSSDSAAAYKTAYELIAKAKTGADFGDLAFNNSQDRTAKQNKGDLYYFTGGQMIPAFEDSAFAMKVGEISSAPVRTQYGLHIIKIVNRKPVIGEMRSSHIMIRFNSADPSPEDTLKAYLKIRAILDSIGSGADFAELAKRNSADGGSAVKGGDLGFFTRRRWPMPFDEVALNMKPGQVSGIVRTTYGYHIIKCFEIRPPKAYEDSKQEIQQLYQQMRFQDDYGRYLAGLKNAVQYRRNDSVVTKFVSVFDTTKSTRDSSWAAGLTEALGRSAIMAFGGKPVTVDSVVGIIKSRPDLANVSLRPSAFLPALDKITEQLIFSIMADTMEKRSSEFAAIMKEYEEGVLLYQVEQENVWNRVAGNDSTLHEYFDAHRSTYMWPDRLNITDLRSINEVVAMQVYKQLEQGKTFERIASEDSARMTAQTNFRAIFTKGSAAMNSEITRTLSRVAKDLRADSLLRVVLTAHSDTVIQKAQNLKLAARRLDALQSYLKGKLNIKEDHITTISKLLDPGREQEVKGAVKNLENIAFVDIIGRQPLVLGTLDTYLLPLNADDRAKQADSLSLGSFSKPFLFRNNYCIVRLNSRETARMKTFEEAATEVAGAFHDFESKRLETKWLEGLRKQYPVVENKLLLKNAFAPAQ